MKQTKEDQKRYKQDKKNGDVKQKGEEAEETMQMKRKLGQNSMS
jgi:hypothetical protein